jgi:nucleotide-binding universal stress UspA family protein
MFSIIVVMAVVTSLMAPFGLRFCLRRIAPEADEVRRINREEALRETFTAGIRRLLIPVRPRPELVGTQRIQALISRRLSETHGTSTMLLASAEPATREAATRYLTRLGSLFDHSDTSNRVVAGTDPVSAILAEAANGYDLLMIGAPTMGSNAESLFGPVLDDLVKLAPCPTVVVRADQVPDDWAPARILVPTDGGPGSRRALDLAFSIAGSGVQVTAVHVVTPSRSGMRTDLAEAITSEIDAVATRLDHAISTTVLEAIDVETGILRAVESARADLLVLGTSVRAGTTRLHLGPRVEYLARHSPCPVIILNA